MKPGFYVGKHTKYLYLVLTDESGVLLNHEDGLNYSIFTKHGMGGAGLYTPATRQDIIDLLLPTIEEKKEPGQVLFESLTGLNWGCHASIGNLQDRYAKAERAVLEAHK